MLFVIDNRYMRQALFHAVGTFVSEKNLLSCPRIDVNACGFDLYLRRMKWRVL
jgi:hypothetical protein